MKMSGGSRLRRNILALAARVTPSERSWPAVYDLEDFINENGAEALAVVEDVILSAVQTAREWDERLPMLHFLSFGPEIGDEAWRLRFIHACLRKDDIVRETALEPLEHWIHRLSADFNRSVEALLEDHRPREPDEDILESIDVIRQLLTKWFGRAAKNVKGEGKLWLHPDEVTSRRYFRSWVQSELEKHGALSVWDLGMSMDAETARKVALNLGAARGTFSKSFLYAVPKIQLAAFNSPREPTRIDLQQTEPENLVIPEIANRRYDIYGEVDDLVEAIFRP